MGVVIEAGFPGIEYPLDHPRVGWQALTGTVTASSAAAGFSASAALDPRTITAWRPAVLSADWSLTFSEGQVVSYVAIGAHDLASRGCGVALQVMDGAGVWSSVPGVAHTPADNGAIMFLLSPRSVLGVRVQVTDPGSATPPTIANIRAGHVLEWPRRAQFTGRPITEARQIEYEFNQSQTGEWMGQTIKRRGLAFDVSISHLSEAWTDTKYAPFRSHADTGQPFYIATRPNKYAGEVAYCLADGLIQSERDIPNRSISRSVAMSLRGYARNG